jgi:CubicO group peptidase (beta-lactamase class C family)
MAKSSNIDDFLEGLVQAEDGPAGCGCAVARDGELLYENYFGYADLKSGKKIDAGSVYRQYSATKVVVCTAAMMLYERGKFLLNDPIYEYFPEWRHTMVAKKQEDGSVLIRETKRPIEVRDCFSMAMGIGYGGPEYTHQMMEKSRANLAASIGDYTLQDDIRSMASVPVMFDPGEHWLYGFGHELVAGLIEVTSGKKVSEFLKEEIFDPLEMKSTGYHYFGDIRERLVTPYQIDGAERVPVRNAMFDDRFEEGAHYEAGGAGLFSTVPDYLKFSQMLACGGMWKGEQIIGRKTIDLMRANQLSEQQLKDFQGDPYLDGYGYGLGVRTRLADRRATGNTSVGEFGWTGYMGTYVAVDPSERMSVVYMHNSVPNRERYVHHRVRDMAFGMLK